MLKKLFALLSLLIILDSCQRHNVIKTHGISYLEQREKLIIVNKSNKNDTINILGQPATKGMKDDNLWIYIERTKVRGKLLKLGRNYLVKNNVLVFHYFLIYKLKVHARLAPPRLQISASFLDNLSIRFSFNFQVFSRTALKGHL